MYVFYRFYNNVNVYGIKITVKIFYIFNKILILRIF